MDDGISSEEYIINFTFSADKIDIISGDSKCWISGLNTMFKAYKIEEVFGCSCNISTKLIRERELSLDIYGDRNTQFSSSTQHIGFSINRQLLSTSEAFPILSRGIPNTYGFTFPDGISNLNLELCN